MDQATIDNLLREIQTPAYEELVSENRELKRALRRRLHEIKKINKDQFSKLKRTLRRIGPVGEIRQLPDLDDLREEYEKEEDKNEFILVEFGEYLDNAGSVASKEKLIERIHNFMRGDESNLTQIPERQLLDESDSKIANYKTKVRDIIRFGGESISPRVTEYLIINTWVSSVVGLNYSSMPTRQKLFHALEIWSVLMNRLYQD